MKKWPILCMYELCFLHTDIHTCTHTYIHIHIHTYIHIHIHAYMHTYMNPLYFSNNKLHACILEQVMEPSTCTEFLHHNDNTNKYAGNPNVELILRQNLLFARKHVSKRSKDRGSMGNKFSMDGDAAAHMHYDAL